MANHTTNRRRLPLMLGVLFLGPGLALAAESRIELRDGSVISGDLIGIGNGVYRVRSTTLGEIAVPESQVLAIRPAGAPVAAPLNTAAPGGTATPTGVAGTGQPAIDLAAMQQQLLGNPATMEAIGHLQSDPEIQAALADPQFTALIMSGNVEALRADPRAQRLMQNPALQAIVGQVLGR